MITKALQNKRELVKQFEFFRISIMLMSLVIWSYYYILLYNQTNSIGTLILEMMIVMGVQGISFIFFTLFQEKIGYLNSYRIAFSFNILTFLLAITFIDNLSEMFILIAIFRGLQAGIFWTTNNALSLKEIHGLNRGSIFSLLQSIRLIIGIIIPIMAGSLINYTGSYQYNFLLGLAVSVIALLYPFKYNKKPRSKIQKEEIYRILGKKDSLKFLVITGIDSAMASAFVVFFLIIPYLLIGNEFGVGALGTLIGIFAAGSAFIDKNQSFKVRKRFAYVGFLIYFFFTFLLSIFWSVPILIIRGLGMSLTSAISSPVYEDINFRVREKLLDKYKNESALEMNLITQAAQLIARLTILGILLVIYELMTQESLDSFIRITIGILSPAFLLTYYFMVKLSEKLKIN